MRRADRLFDIVQILRTRRVVKARELAERLEVSERTVYRDIASLMASGLPIDGEAGIGYMLRAGHDLPPLMFREDEIEALVLGLRIVRAWTDAELARSARTALGKIEAVLPERLRAHAEAVPLDAPAQHHAEPLGIDPAAMRQAIRERAKLAIAYTALDGAATERVVCPLILSFFGPVWTLTAWCELRRDFRVFRLDRIAAATATGELFGPEHRLALKRQRCGTP